MSKVSWTPCVFRCMRCSSDEQMRVIHALPFGHPDRRPISFKAWFWTASTFRGKPLTPTLRDIKCPYCGAHAAWFERYPRECTNFIMPLREDIRPVIFRSVDARGREHYRYPARNDAPAREGEEKIDFPTLRSMTTFLKEQNPGWGNWQVPLNDILDYDESHIDIPAFDTSDPGAAEDADDIGQTEDFGVLDEAPDPSTIKMSFAGGLKST